MPRFFLDISNGHGDVPDEEGIDLPDQGAAMAMAVDSIRSMVAEDTRQGVIDLVGYIAVKDEAQNLLLTVRFAEAFRVHLPDGLGPS
jgi:hypothetical protein